MKKVLKFAKSKMKKRRDKKRAKPSIEMDKKYQDALLEDLEMVKRNMDNLKRQTEIYIGAVKKIRERYDCRQFQLIVMDLESVLEHIEDLEENGARDPDTEIPLSESEIKPEELKRDIEQAAGIQQ